MFIFLLCVFTQFSTQYKAFLNSPRSESLFISLARGDYRISEFVNDPIVLWFWRSNTGNPEADSLLTKTPIKQNFYLSAVLRWEATEATDYETTLSKLNLATHLDSSAIENFFSYIALAVKYRMLEHLQTAFRLPVFSDLRSQLFIITNSIFLLLLSLFMSSIVYIGVKLSYYARVLSHRIDPLPHNQTKGLLAFLILLIPVLIFRQLYIIFVCYALVLIFVLRSREKRWLRFYIIALLLVSIAASQLVPFISFLKQYDKNYQLYEIVRYDSDVTLNARNYEEKKLLAYGLKQRREFDRALAVYEEIYYTGTPDFEVVNNLANLYFLYDENALAETLYNHAMQLEDRGEPYFNLGLLKLKNIEYLESSIYMEEARRRNFSSPHEEPVDIAPTNAEFYNIIGSKKFRPFGLIAPIYFIVLVIVLMLTFVPLSFSPPFYCAACSRPLCEQCRKIIEGEVLCENCFTRFKSAKSAEVEQSLRNLVAMRRKKLQKIISYSVNAIIPGAGLLYLGKHVSGFAIVFFVMLGYVPLLLPNLFIVPTGWISLPLRPVFLAIAILIAIISYIFSFLFVMSSHAD